MNEDECTRCGRTDARLHPLHRDDSTSPASSGRLPQLWALLCARCIRAVYDELIDLTVVP